MKINDFVIATHKGKGTLAGRVAAISESTGKYSVEYFDPDVKNKDGTIGGYKKVSKSEAQLQPGCIELTYPPREARNIQLLKSQNIGLYDWVILQDDPRFMQYTSMLPFCEAVGLDIETLGYFGKDAALHPLTGDIRLIQVYLPTEGVCLIYDLGELKNRSPILMCCNGLYQLESVTGGKELELMLRNPGCKKYIHNAGFEQLWFNYCCDIQLFNVVDSMILAQIFWAGMARGMEAIGMKNPNSIKWVAFRLNMPLPDKEDQLWDYAFALGSRQFNYGGTDGKLTADIGMELERRMSKMGMTQAKDAEMRAIPAFGQMQYMGIPVNVDKVHSFHQTYQECIDKLKEEWWEEFPGVSPTSGQQAAKAILERYDVDLTKVSPTTGEDTDSIGYDILAPYFEEYPILRTLASINSIASGLRYLKNIKTTMKPNKYGVVSVRGQFRQLASPGSMGRSGCGGKEPYVQLQTPPKGTAEWKRLGLPRLRSVFDVTGQTIDGDELCFVSFDLSGSHAQIVRYLSQDPKLLAALEQNIKVHFFTSEGILKAQGYDYSIQDIIKIKKGAGSTDEQELIAQTYEFSKTSFYSSLNGGGATRLQGSFKELDPPVMLSLEECRVLAQGTKEAYPTMFRYMYSLPKEAERKNHIIPVWFDDRDNPIYWGYYGGKEANKKALVRPPGVKPDAQPRYVGQNKGKYSGYMPGKIRFYGELRSPDGARFFLQKEPNRDGNYQCLLGDATAFMWQTIERTGIKKAAGIITEECFKHPEWFGYVPSFLHDELMGVCKKKYAREFSTLFCNTIIECMREVVADFTSEVEDPMECVSDYWKK